MISTGNHIFSRPDWPELLKKQPQVLRPHNLGSENAAGSGWKIFSRPDSQKIAVMNIAGRVFMESAVCPFKTFDQLYAEIPKGIPVIVDFHAEATSEKLAFFWYVNASPKLFGRDLHSCSDFG
jgi:calcineurin-like phosphoesterase